MPPDPPAPVRGAGRRSAGCARRGSQRRCGSTHSAPSGRCRRRRVAVTQGRACVVHPRPRKYCELRSHGAGRPPSRGRGAARALPGAGRRHPRRRSGARSSSSAGRNGAGKTTLLRLCAGLLPVAAARPSVLGCDLRSDRRAVRAQVGLLGHANGLYDDLTVAENVRFWGRDRRRHRRRDRHRHGPPRPGRAPGRRRRRTASRPASAGGPPSPSLVARRPSCGCSTSPTPGSTPTAATCSTTSLAPGRRRPAPR